MTHSYPALTNEWLEERSGRPVSFRNHCLGGARATTGVALMQHEVLIERPDLIIVEYGIIDGSVREPTLSALEQIVRSSIEENLPLVLVALTTERVEDTPRQIIKELGEYYGVPVADVHDQLIGSNLSWEDVGLDGWHPGDDGHALIFESISKEIEKLVVNNLQVTAKMPDRLGRYDLSRMTLSTIAEVNYVRGDFDLASSDLFPSRGANLSMSGSSDPSTIQFTFKGSYLGALFAHDAVPSLFEYRIDGGKWIKYSPMRWEKDFRLATGLGPGEHSVEMSITPGDDPTTFEGFIAEPAKR